MKRQIRVVKERAMAIRSTLPFKKMPGRMIAQLINHFVLWLYAYHPKRGVSNTLSPRATVTRTTVEYKKHCRIPVWAYAQVHEDKAPTITLDQQSHHIIYLGHTGIYQ